MTNLRITYSEVIAVARSIQEAAETAEVARNSAFPEVGQTIKSNLVTTEFPAIFAAQYSAVEESSRDVIEQFKNLGSRLEAIAEAFRETDESAGSQVDASGGDAESSEG